MNFLVCLVGETLNLLSGGRRWVGSQKVVSRKAACKYKRTGFFSSVFTTMCTHARHNRLPQRALTWCFLLDICSGEQILSLRPVRSPQWLTSRENVSITETNTCLQCSWISFHCIINHHPSSQQPLQGSVLSVMKSCNSSGRNSCPICLTSSSS